MGIIEYNKKVGQIRTKQTLRTEVRKTIRALIITLTTMIVILGGVFLALTTKSAEKGYSLEQLKLKNEELKTENNNLKAHLTDITSFSDLDENSQVKEMTTPQEESKTFVTKEDNEVK